MDTKTPSDNILHADKHRWVKHLSDDILTQFGKSNRRKIRSCIDLIENLPITVEFQPITEIFLEEFVPLYENIIKQKDNPFVLDLHQLTFERKIKYPYQALVLRENGKLVGATIFNVKPDRLSIAYRAYGGWIDVELAATPSLYTEYIITKHAKEVGKDKMVHGIDWNPYGLNTDIGLCTFKLSMGFHPELPDKFETLETSTDVLKQSVLVLHMPQDDSKRILKATLFTDDQNLEKNIQVTKYPEQLEIDVQKINLV